MLEWLDEAKMEVGMRRMRPVLMLFCYKFSFRVAKSIYNDTVDPNKEQ